MVAPPRGTGSVAGRARARRPRAPAALHPPPGRARGPRALPDGLRAREGQRGRAHGRPPLHAERSSTRCAPRRSHARRSSSTSGRARSAPSRPRRSRNTAWSPSPTSSPTRRRTAIAAARAAGRPRGGRGHDRRCARWRRPRATRAPCAPARARPRSSSCPGYAFRVVDALITNFHLPRSSLLLLVAAFAGRERVLAAYVEAVRAGYRFYSYGDAMLLSDGRARAAAQAEGLRPRALDQRLQEDLVADQLLRRRQQQVHAAQGRAHLRRRVADLGQQAQEARGIEARRARCPAAARPASAGRACAPPRTRPAAPRRRGPRARAACGRSRRRWPARAAASPRARARPRWSPASWAGPGRSAASTCSGVSRVSSSGPTSPRIRCTSWGTTTAPVAGGGASPTTRSRSSFSPKERARRERVMRRRSRLGSRTRRPAGLARRAGPRAARPLIRHRPRGSRANSRLRAGEGQTCRRPR